MFSEVNPSDPGTYRVLGFELPTSIQGDADKCQCWRCFFFYFTGTKTFIDHRDENGNVVNITYRIKSEFRILCRK